MMRTQEQIMQNWRDSENCTVSVVCTTYNHEKYIRQALDGFLAQRTSFPFEIIVHDDASTDGTRAVIEQYASRYPLLVKPVFQSINRYSQGGFKPMFHAAEFASGTYLALCEGDDFWICDVKLQRQVDALEAHPELDFCFHSAYCLVNDVQDKFASWQYEGREILGTRDILECATGTFAPTSSYMIRREVPSLLPAWFYGQAPVGDFFIELYGSLRGGALYLDFPMSIYRTMRDGSWHVNTYGNDTAFEKYLNAMLKSVSLAEGDFPGLGESFSWKRAWLYSFAAIHYLRRDAYIQFREYIEKAKAEHGFMSRKHALAYSLRRWPRLAGVMLSTILRIKHSLLDPLASTR